MSTDTTISSLKAQLKSADKVIAQQAKQLKFKSTLITAEQYLAVNDTLDRLAHDYVELEHLHRELEDCFLKVLSAKTKSSIDEAINTFYEKNRMPHV